MKITLKEILVDFKISRQTFYEMNKKSGIFDKIGRGFYKVHKESYKKIKAYYEDKAKKKGIETCWGRKRK